MFEFPDLRDPPLEHSSLHVHVSLGPIHVTLWELAVSELVQENANTLATSYAAINNSLCLCLRILVSLAGIY